MVKNILIAFVFTVLLVIIPVVQAGTVTRVFDSTSVEALTNMNVTLVVVVDEATEKFYAIDEIVPSEWAIVDPGFLNDSQAGHLKKMNTSDASDTSYTYEVTSPNVPGPYGWSGIYQIDGMESDTPILGGITVDVGFCTNGELQPCRVGGLPVDDTGECALGQEICTDGEWIGDCNYPAPVFATAELCDTLDNNCDGSSDELWPELGTVCTEGLGECEDTGNYVCTGDLSGSECSATPGTPVTEQCPSNRIDDDCDGENDEFNGDADCDCIVDVVGDLSLVGAHFGEVDTDSNWDPRADLIIDDVVDIFDLVIVGVSFNNDYSGDPGC